MCSSRPAALPGTAGVWKLGATADDNLWIKCGKLTVLGKLQIQGFLRNLRLSCFLSKGFVLLFLSCYFPGISRAVFLLLFLMHHRKSWR